MQNLAEFLKYKVKTSFGQMYTFYLYKVLFSRSKDLKTKFLKFYYQSNRKDLTYKFVKVQMGYKMY